MSSIVVILFILIPAMAYASPAEEYEESTIPIFESAQQLLGGRVNTVANRLDLFFADQRADDELARSRIRIRQTYEVRERAMLNKETQIRFNIRLPKLEEKFRYEAESDTEAEKKAKEDKKNKAKVKELEAVSENTLNKRWQFKADIGINVSVPPKIAARARLRKNWETGDVIHRFVEEWGWFSDRDWEENTSLDSDLPIEEETLLRFSNSSDWKVTRKDFKTAHGPSVRHRLSDDDAISFGLGLSTIVDESWFVNNYRIGATYRRNLYHQWLYMDTGTGLDFPKIHSFRRTPFILFQLEALFGGI
ncbi:MAG: hypothetical protein H0V66_14865 [Bdellovibrionales bacterium]|nr:hypothetical protein [Bdellovibrionales bacterium]